MPRVVGFVTLAASPSRDEVVLGRLARQNSHSSYNIRQQLAGSFEKKEYRIYIYMVYGSVIIHPNA
jgi:hypothetical protein